MKPPPFDYLAPSTLGEALAALAQHGPEAKVLAGGQSLVPMLNFRLARPSVLIDLNRVSELAGIAETAAGGLRLGALTRHRQLEHEPRIANRAPLLAEAAPHIAHPQIRNRGTLGGSLAHADPAAELPALMLALEARFEVRSERGVRTVAAADFFVGLLTADLAADEVLVAVEVPPLPARTGTAFLEVARRHGDYAQVGVAALLSLDDEARCREARLAFLAVGEGPLRAAAAEAQLLGQQLGAGEIASAAKAAAAATDPSSDVHASAAFKRHLAEVLARRALTLAARRAGARAEAA